jgi:hypothetical protein
LHRMPMLEDYTFSGGHFRRKLAAFDADAFSPDAFQTGRSLNTVAVGIAGVSAVGSAGEIRPEASSDKQGSSATDIVWVEGTVPEIAHRMSTDPLLFERLATDAAKAIQKQLAKFAEKIPNEPEAHAGYEEVRLALTALKVGFEQVAAELRQVNLSATPDAKETHVQKAAVAARSMADNFIDWMVEKGPITGRVLAHLGLATLVTATITYVAGVNPTTTFLVATGALSGKDIWDVVKLFASKKD